MLPRMIGTNTIDQEVEACIRINNGSPAAGGCIVYPNA